MNRLSTRIPPVELTPDGANLRDVFHQVWDAVRRIVIAVNEPMSGDTASRPSLALIVGDTFFDTDLGIPIWWDGTQWVNASGTPV